MIINDITNLFIEFADGFTGLNYILILSVIKIQLQHKEFISHDLLDKVFTSDDAPQAIEGPLEECASEEAQAKINDVLGYQATRGGDIERCTIEELRRRQQIFWSLVESQITLPPAQTYSHTAYYKSRLSFGTYWNFCYIFVNGKEAFAIAMGAAD